MAANMSNEEEATLNIGALSMATGVPVETIRTWERRYGFPESQRNDAGHRIYSVDTIEHLRMITEVLDQGYRPSQLRGLSREDLENLLERSRPKEEAEVEEAPKAPAESQKERRDRSWVDGWMSAVASLDRESLEGLMRSEFSRMTALNFLEDRVGPFLVELGTSWATGRLSVLHEHFASECLRDFLVSAWRPMSDRARGAPIVLGTLSGEQHCLGLHMAALVAALSQKRVVFLGVNTPVGDLAAASEQCGADAIALSVSTSAHRGSTRAFLRDLLEMLPPNVEVLIGGGGAPADVEGTRAFRTLREFQDYLED